MTPKQAEDCQEVANWCRCNLKQLQAEGKTLDEMVQAGLNHIAPFDEICPSIGPDVIREYIAICLS